MGTDIHHKKENYNFAEKAKKKFSKYLTEDEINDIFENRVREYQDDYFLSGFNYMSEVRYEE